MKLLRVEIVSAATCGGLLDGFVLDLSDTQNNTPSFTPICLVGPNGAGKSQLLQVIAEMFQAAFHACVPSEERRDGNPTLQFKIEYIIALPSGLEHVRISRSLIKRNKASLRIERKVAAGWSPCPIQDPQTVSLLPLKIIGYTSGDNETLSLPFLISRSGYADEVTGQALRTAASAESIPDTRLMLVDYATHLELLVSNLLLGGPEHRNSLLDDVRLDDLNSFRCVVQLAHSAAPKAPASLAGVTSRKGIQLTAELETYVDQLRRCCTAHSFNEKTETYTFDFRVDEAVRTAFRTFFSTPLELYSALHKLAMLNDLAIPKSARQHFKHATNTRRFASRLPEPQDEDKVFRFEQVTFKARGGKTTVDYVSLSDGEHQLVQILGTFAMFSSANILFLLDEPESHFNPKWRVNFLSRVEALNTGNGARNLVGSSASQQDVLLTTHAPFVPSDMPRERVLIFTKEEGRIAVRHPNIQTYGTRFDLILEECFGVRPPMSALPRADIKRLLESTDAEELRVGIERLGSSVDKAFLVDRLNQIVKQA